MTDNLSAGTRTELRRFLNGEMSVNDLDDWLTSSDYDEELDQVERDVIARIRLLLIQVGEEQRSMSDLHSHIARLVGDPTTSKKASRVRTA